MRKEREGPVVISVKALQRMPYYLQHLKKLRDNGIKIVAAPAIAASLELNEIQVRKDLSAVSSIGGKPKTGFVVLELIETMEEFLGYNKRDSAVLVGVGSLGKALLSYNKFVEYGLQIVTAFDTNQDIIGSEVNGKTVFSFDKIVELCRRLKIRAGIITVPAEQAQIVCDRLVEAGVIAIWNFAPVHLYTPKDVLVKNENMAASLALLLKHLKEKK